MAKTNVTVYLKGYYDNIPSGRARKNKANSKPILGKAKVKRQKVTKQKIHDQIVNNQ